MAKELAVDQDHLLEEAFRLFRRAVVRTDPGRLEAWVGLGLTVTQLRILLILRAVGNLTAGGLAERLDVTPSTLTRIMDRLVRQDLVRREVDIEDRRCVRHYLSDQGVAAVEELERTGRAYMTNILRQLSHRKLDRLVVGLRDLLEATEAAQREVVKA